jgi:Protein of unknown function (DUF3122)
MVIKTVRPLLNQLLIVLGLLVAFVALSLAITPAATASILYTADTSGSVIVQSRRTLRDQDRYSWQVIAFKPIHADTREGELALRLVGFPGAVQIDHSRPITFTGPKGETLSVDDASDRIAVGLLPQPHVGQYQLQTALPTLPTEYRLQLNLPTQPPTILQISPALIQEWQTVVNTHHDDVVHACQLFPVEAQHNPAFPAWVDCP